MQVSGQLFSSLAYLIVMNFFSRMVYIQILRQVATMVGTSKEKWSLNAIDD